MTQLDLYGSENLPGSPLPQGPAIEAARRGFLQIIWSRRLIVLVTTLVLAVASFTYVQLATPVYMGAARIYVQENGPKIISNDELGNPVENRGHLYTECELIHSTPILVAALESPGIKDLPTFANEKAALFYMAKHLTATLGRQDDLIAVSFESEHAEDIPKVLNAVYDSYQNFQSTRKKNTATEVMKILQREKVKRDGEMSENLKSMLAFKTEHPELGFQGEKGNIIVQRLERLSTALTEAELALVEAKADYDAVTSMKSDPAKVREFFETKRAMGKVIVAGAGGDEGSRLQAFLSEQQLRLDDLKREYATSNLAVQKVENEIKTVQQQMAERDAKSAELQMAVVQQQYKSAQERLARVSAAYDTQIQQALGLNKVMIEYARLQSNYDQSKKLVELLDSRVKEVNVTEDVGAMNISLIELPSKPEKPIRPDKLRIVGIACGLGLVLGIGLALLRDWRDPRLGSVEEITATLGAPIVGLLPELKDKRYLEEPDFLGRAVLQFPQSPMAEAFRSLRTTLTFGMQDVKARTILVTSPDAQEGKSTLISNLAITMAQAGQRTLVLDADFRQPSQHEIFKLSNDKGLSSVLQDGADVEASIRPSEQPGLDVLTAGPSPLQPSELLNSARFKSILGKLGEQYDQILVDSPPVTAVSDSLILAARCDATLLVVRADRSHRNLAEEARKLLSSVGVRICGVVVNATPLKKYRYGYFTDYYQQEAKTDPGSDDSAPPGDGGGVSAEPAADDGKALPAQDPPE